MTTVVGLDPSLTGTGLAIITDTPPGRTLGYGEIDPPRLYTIASTGKKGATWRQRHDRLVKLRNDTMRLVPRDTRLAVMEGPSFASTGAGQHDRSWYWGKLYDALTSLGIPVAVCPPKTRAKWVCDNGNGGKADVAMGIARMWPGVEIRGDDQADGLCFASIGAQHLGLPLPYLVLERHKLALSKIEWP
ncbi:hypothetical protein [Nocardia sp. NPDC004260]